MTDCSVEGCEKRRKSKGLCSMHAARLRRHGDVHKVIHQRDRSIPRAEDHHRWTGEDVSYSAVHQRLKKVRGPAREQVCQCGRQANQWSYIGPREQGQRMPHAADLNLYEAKCAPCHKAADLSELDPNSEKVFQWFQERQGLVTIPVRELAHELGISHSSARGCLARLVAGGRLIRVIRGDAPTRPSVYRLP